MIQGNRWLVLAGLVLAGTVMAGAARAQVVINSVNEGQSYTVPSTGVATLGGAESIGPGGGTISQALGLNTLQGGTLSIGVGESVFPFLGGAGTYTLTGGTVQAGIEQLGIGDGNGTFDQLNGSNQVGTLSLLGQTAANGVLHGSAIYKLGGGTLTATILSVGDGTATDNGLFQFNGGTADFSAMQINLGGAVTASGNEILDAANPTYTTRTITQSGGSNTVTGSFALGVAGTTVITNGVVTGYTPNVDSYALQSGSLTAGSEALGIGGNAAFTQSGGTNTVQAGGTLAIGSAGIQVAPGIGGGGVASYDLAQGTLTAPAISVADSGTLQFNGGAIDFGQLTSLGTLSASGNEVLDQAGAVNTSYHVYQNHGTNTVAGALEVGASGTTGGTGTFTGNAGYYNLAASTSQLSAGAEVVGLAGAGFMIQSNGTNTIASTGASTVTLSDGTTVAAGTLMLGDTATSSGTYQLSGLTSQLSAASEVVGNNGTGSFTQVSGTNTTGTLTIAQSTGSGSYTLSGGTLSAAAEVIGLAGSGSFTQTGGANTLTGSVGVPVLLSNGTAVSQDTLTIGLAAGSAGTYALRGGSLIGAVNVSAYGTFNLSGGTQQGQITNNGLFAETTGGRVGTLTNNTTATVAGTLTAGQITNAGLFTLSGGTVSTTGGFTNNSTLTGSGTLSGTGAFVNANLFTQSGGSFTLAATGANGNTDEIDLTAGTLTPFQIAAGSTLANDGLIKLNGGTLSGGGTLINATGVIGGTGRIGVAQFHNQGTLTADAGLTSLSGTVTNSGIIQLTGTGALLTGSSINNTGTIEGAGQINNSIGNLGGSIQALGGTLILGGAVTTSGTTTLLAATGGQLLLAGAFTDEGTISLAGGNFDDTSSQAITNNGTISGYGVFTAAGLANNRTILVAGGTATYNTAVVNNLGGTIAIDNTTAVFNDAVTNDGTITTHFGNASYAGTFTNNGTVISDPSTQTFTGDLVEGTTGVIQAAAGDRYVVEGGFLNHSTQNASWNTTGAILEFAAGGASALHTLALAGADLGIGLAGYQNNFAWNTLAIDSGQSLSLSDGVSAANVAFYTDVLTGAAISGSSITNITGNGYNIYYDPLFATNLYLHGLTYDLTGGGQLIADSVPTPEPAAGALLAGFVLILAGLRPRRR